MPIDNQWYTELFSAGIRAACNEMAREVANAHAHSLSVKEGDAFLAGYYAERRKQYNDRETRIMSRHEDSATYRADMIDAGRGRLLR